MQDLSRREFIGGMAGVAAVAMLPSSSSIQAAVTPLAGATVNLLSYGVGNYLKAANIYNGYVGLPLATTIQKIYMANGVLGTQPPVKMTQLAAAGCQFMVDVRPSKTMTPAEQSRLAKFLAALTSSGMSYRILLYSECNNQAFSTPEQWQAYWSYYAPVIKDAGVACGYDPGCSYYSISRAETFFPSNPTPDELWMDYYATSFRSGSRVDTLMAMAEAVGVPIGLAEWGWAAGNTTLTPMIMPWWNEYCTYLIRLASAKKLTLGTIYFGSAVNHAKTDVIGSSSDPRIPMIRNIANAVQAA